MGHSTHTEAWIEVVRSLGERDFITRYSGYFLLSSEEPGELPTLDDTDIVDLNVPPAGLRRVRKFEVRWVASAQGAPPSDRITVGRAGYCAIVFRTPAVSKLHAHFRVQGKTLTVTDLGSRNGTRVNGKALVPHRSEPVSVHDRIQFSTVQTMLVEGRELYLMLSRVR